MKLRWIERDGEKVLQEKIKITYDSTYGRGLSDPEYTWEDVPTHREPEKKVEITEKQLEEAMEYHCAHPDFTKLVLKRLGF